MLTAGIAERSVPFRAGLHGGPPGMKTDNRVKQLREAQLMSKAELARKAGISALTVDRVENGQGCRLDTKRKIILALGMTVADRDQVFLPDAGAETSTDGADAAKE